MQNAMGNIFDYWKGNEQDRKRLFDNQKLFIRDYSGKLERPAVLFIKGKPAYLYAAPVSIFRVVVWPNLMFLKSNGKPKSNFNYS